MGSGTGSGTGSNAGRLVAVAVAALLALAVLTVGLVSMLGLTGLTRGGGPDAEEGAAPPSRVPADLRLVARFDLDEELGARLFRDRRDRLVGRIGAEVTTNGRHHGYGWVEPGSGHFPGHTDVVPASRRLHRLLDPGAGTFMVTVRYQTRHSFGNIVQKGQGTAPGGYWKIENPGRAPRCMFRGGNGQTRTGYIAGLDSGARLSPGWHTLTCVRTPEWVQMWVDGVAQPRAWGPSGVIRNDYELSIGGKSVCDAREVSCDYFSGRIDFIEFRRGR